MDKDLHAKSRELRKNLTQAELKLWLYLRKKQLKGFKFRRQHPIPPYIVDFYCPAAKLVVEVDGASHCGEEAYDIQRQNFLERQGLSVLRFSNDELYNHISKVLYCICNHLEKSEKNL